MWRLPVAFLLLVCCVLAKAETRSPPLPASPDGADAVVDLSSANAIGINIGAPLDYSQDRLYADVMKTARAVTLDGSQQAPTDTEDWPTVPNFQILLWGDMDQMHGSYAFSAKGHLASLSATYGNGTVSGLAYSVATDTTTAMIEVPDAASSNFALTFAEAYRDAARSRPGLTDIKIMRPIAPGSSTPFDPSVLFNTPLKAMIQKFSVVRFMDFLATNWNAQANWSDRTLPVRRSYARPAGKDSGWQGQGGPWEHVILFANAVNRDAWITIPARASDEYVTRVAQLFAYGSDGVNPYASSRERPVYPPLDPRLKLYVEYSNELWNYAFSQAHMVDALAADKKATAPIRYDGEGDVGALHARYVAMRSAQISLMFRRIFGSAAMMRRIRPILAAQSSSPTGPGGIDAMLVFAFDHLCGGWRMPGTREKVGQHPPSYYWYGAGGAAYYSPSDASSVEAVLTSGEMDPTTWTASGQLRDMQAPAVFGIRRIAYEGGPNLGDWSQGHESINQPAAVMTFPPRSPNMTDVFAAHHDAWSRLGGDLLVYYNSTSDYRYGLAPISKRHPNGDVHDLDSPKLRAVDALAARPRAAITVGSPIPGRLPGASHTISSTFGRASSGAGFALTATARGWRTDTAQFTGYLFRMARAASRSIRLTLSGSSRGKVSVYFDGAALGTVGVVNGPITFRIGAVAPGLHGVIVQAVQGRFIIEQVAVE
ncbi:MAG TPA: hypothetical protein VMK12_20040 [Anaeromyxobacteraceae bacterium]|nr:hypothetical protein [Anaeromyxobacteraceae bacterium]